MIFNNNKLVQKDEEFNNIPRINYLIRFNRNNLDLARIKGESDLINLIRVYDKLAMFRIGYLFREERQCKCGELFSYNHIIFENCKNIGEIRVDALKQIRTINFCNSSFYDFLYFAEELTEKWEKYRILVLNQILAILNNFIVRLFSMYNKHLYLLLEDF